MSEDKTVEIVPGSVEDRAILGFTREQIIASHGVDLGPRVGKGLGHLRGFDRGAYRAMRVREMNDDAAIAALLEEVATDRLDSESAALALGLGPRRPALGELFADLGLTEEWAAARRAAVSSRADRTKATNMARYGGISPMASAAVRAKVVATTQERHGVDNVSQLQVTKDRKRAVSRERYGTDSPLQAAEVQAKSRATVRDRYGVDNVSQSDEVKDLKREVSMRRYGVPTPALDPEVRAKMVESLRASTPDLPEGATTPMQAPSVRERAKRTHRERHGVGNPFELASTQQHIKETMVERYGASNPSLVEEHRERRTETIRERYGVDNTFQSEELMEGAQERAQLTMLERYGNTSYVATKEGQIKINESKSRNGTHSTSSPEEAFYALLVECFGADDVVRQHRDEVRYPWACDFYIVSRDLFIELNGSWTHGGHWCDFDCAVDAKKLAKWQSKADDGSAYYANAIYVWTDLDARKRESARKHSLNYVVLWDGGEDLLDAHLWLSLGMPDGRDWEREYSWLEDRSLDASIPWPKALDERPRTTIAAARAANGEVLYSRELAAWNADDVHARSWGRTRARILANRLRHVGKTPDVLRDIEVLRGFGISGALRAHTAFDNGGMVEVLEEFSPTRVYDPCAGWGERMATCAALGIEYLGVDINEAVVEGHARMAAQYSLSAQRTVHADAAQHDASGFDADLVFTCPPYGDVEIYTEHGAENLDDDAFLAWWGEVVDCSVGPSTEVFAFQVNQLWRDRMVAVLEDRGWRLERRIDVGRGRVSHFNRASDGTPQKREFEQIQVLVRV